MDEKEEGLADESKQQEEVVEKDYEIDIDKSLEDKAAQSNLSVQNVKSVIHYVLKDERVMKMVQKIAETGTAEDEVIYEPKLTRLRVRQAVASSSSSVKDSPVKRDVPAAVTPSPNKTSAMPLHVVPHPLLGMHFSEESSDDEYNPASEVTKDTDDLESDTLGLEEDELAEEEEEEEGESNSGDETEREDDQEKENEDGMESIVSTPRVAEEEMRQTEQQEDGCGMGGEQEEQGQLETPAVEKEKSPVNVPPPLTPPTSTASMSAVPNTGVPHSEEQLVQETAVLLASLSDTILSPERPARPLLPPSIPHEQQTDVNLPETTNDDEVTGEIAHRTRSKFPLVDKDINEIEASFVPPDVPPDDSILSTLGSSMDVDEEELQWQEWLADLMNPQSTRSHEGDDQDDDTEYNFYAEHHEDEKEEFRTDRGVKIPQKEVDELIEEILNPDSGLFNTDLTCLTGLDPNDNDGRGCEGEEGLLYGSVGMDPTSAYLLESLGLHLPTQLRYPTPKKTPTKPGGTVGGAGNPQIQSTAMEQGQAEPSYLTTSQMLQLWDQIQQHFQLLLQTFLLARFEPSLVFLSQIACQAIEEIIQRCDERKQGTGSSIWYVPGVEEGRELIKRYDPDDNKAAELVPAIGQPPKVPAQVQDIIMSYGVFWQYPSLIPDIGFCGMDHSKTNNTSKYFLPSEDCLLVLGMKNYGASAWKVIQQNLLPTKAPKQLSLRVKNCSSKNRRNNVVKYYKKTGEIKIPFTSSTEEEGEGTCNNVNGDGPSVPVWVQNYHRKRLEKEKAQEKEKEKELEACRALSQCLAGSKRSLSEQLSAVELGVKRMKHQQQSTRDTTLTDKGGRKKRIKKDVSPDRGASKENSNVKKSCKDSKEYRQLLYLAGLEADEPAARFAYKYLTEVKATVMDSQGVYDEFLKLLTLTTPKSFGVVRVKESKRKKMAVSEVCDILRPWPHLLKLFMGFVEPLDALEANVLAEKLEFERVKTFVNSLERKYSNSPLQLEEIISVMSGLGKEEDVTPQKVITRLSPLIEAHEDLLQDLNSFIEGVHLRLSNEQLKECCEDDFEEIDLTEGKKNITDVDDFEEMTIGDDWSPLAENGDMVARKEEQLSVNNNQPAPTDGITGRHGSMVDVPLVDITQDGSSGTETSVNRTVTFSYSATSSVGVTNSLHSTSAILSQGSLTTGAPSSSLCPPVMSSVSLPDVVSTGSTGTTSSQTVTATCTLLRGGEEETSRQSEQPKPWTRDDDRVLLQTCLQMEHKQSGGDTLKLIADQLKRPFEEVRTRCNELLTLMKAMTST